MDKTLLARVAALPNMPLSELKALWWDVYEDEPPGGHKSDSVRRLADRLQELAYGVDPPRLRTKLCTMPKAIRLGNQCLDSSGPPIDVATLKGGASLLQDIALCPFRSVARHRLMLQKNPLAQTGLDALTRVKASERLH